MYTEGHFVGLVGQLVVVRKRFENRDISYQDYKNIGSYKLAKMCGTSRYHAVRMADYCKERGWIHIEDAIHRSYYLQDGKRIKQTKLIYFASELGKKKVQSWIDLGKYGAVLERIMRGINEKHRRKVSEDVGVYGGLFRVNKG